MFFSRRKNDDLSEKLVKLVVPIAIQQFMLALVSATDAVMLGFVDQTSLSAASLAGQIQFVLNLFSRDNSRLRNNDFTVLGKEGHKSY